MAPDGGVKGKLNINAAGTANDKTIIEGDGNGDRRADFQIELIGLKTLTAGDFIVYPVTATALSG